MWWPTPPLVLGTVAAAVVGARCIRRRDAPIDDLEAVRTIEQLTRWVARYAKRTPTDQLIENLRALVRKRGIREKALVHLSELHRQWGGDLGRNGYAVTIVWTAILSSVQEDDALILVD